MTRLAHVPVALLVLAFPAAAAPTIGGCPVFPADNYWNTAVDTLPVHSSSASWVATIGNTARLHADWGNVLSDFYGIPYVTVTGAQPLVPIVPDPSQDYSDESDPGPYPVPPNAQVEGGPASTGDRHVLVVETTNCVLYELYNAYPLNGGTSWQASSYAKWPLNSNALRPADWTSADAAGLAIFPGLVRYDEAASGNIEHAIRFTANSIWGKDPATGGLKYVWPARHNSGSSSVATRPPMGARFRLKASYTIPSTFSPLTQAILRAMKKYGLVLADGGSNWFFQGVSDTRWPDAVFSELGQVTGSNFEAVDAQQMLYDVNTARAVLPATVAPRLANVSTRMQVLTGSNVMIGGFIVSGSTSKTVVVRARGPSLAASGIANPLANPVLQIVRSSDQATIAVNDDWQAAANAADISRSGFAPLNALESAVMMTLPPGGYSAIVTGVGGGTGVGLVEVFEVDHPDVPLIDIATRGFVQTGDNVMIAGFIVQGNAPQTVVVRARGPSLAAQGVPSTLANPALQLVRSSDFSTIASNDDWQSAPNAVAIQASGLQPLNPAESAIMMTLDPGAYTAIVSGVGATTGVAIVEVLAAP